MESLGRTVSRKLSQRKKKLSSLFIAYLARFGVTIAAVIILEWMLFSMAIQSGMILPASYESSQIEQVRDDIISGGQVEEELLPPTCRFGVYDKNGTYLYGNFRDKEKEEAWKRRTEDKESVQVGLQTFYRYLPKANGQVTAIRYKISAQFANPIWDQYSPGLDMVILLLALFLILVVLAVTGKQFGKYLQKRLDVLMDTAGKIQQEDLEFQRESSDIQEIDEVLGAMFAMKEELKKSLNEQWNAEEEKQEQIAALAHDIKTPLTIIRGNAELLQETDNLEERREYESEILDNVKSMERYLQLLRDTIRKGGGESACKNETIEVSGWLQDIRDQAESLGRSRQLEVQVSGFELEGRLYGNREHLLRAVVNILANGAEYSVEKGSLMLSACIDEKEGCSYLKLEVLDSGPGFEEETLLRGTDKFYQGEKSRTGREHYGLGLYIARTFLEEAGGSLKLENVQENGQVSIWIPMKCDKVTEKEKETV